MGSKQNRGMNVTEMHDVFCVLCSSARSLFIWAKIIRYVFDVGSPPSVGNRGRDRGCADGSPPRLLLPWSVLRGGGSPTYSGYRFIKIHIPKIGSKFGPDKF